MVVNEGEYRFLKKKQVEVFAQISLENCENRFMEIVESEIFVAVAIKSENIN